MLEYSFQPEVAPLALAAPARELDLSRRSFVSSESASSVGLFEINNIKVRNFWRRFLEFGKEELSCIHVQEWKQVYFLLPLLCTFYYNAKRENIFHIMRLTTEQYFIQMKAICNWRWKLNYQLSLSVHESPKLKKIDKGWPTLFKYLKNFEIKPCKSV